jgi:Cytochrome P460
VLYTLADRYDIKQYRELYTSREAVQAAREGKPLPNGTVITMVQYKAQVDAHGNPIKDTTGRFLKGDLVGFAIMEKRQGWGPSTRRTFETVTGSIRPSPPMASSTTRQTSRRASSATNRTTPWTS